MSSSSQQQQEKEVPKKKQRWFPLESNPDLINSYITKLGFDASSDSGASYEFVDVFSTEEWALAMVPQPVLAVLLLYPLTKSQLENTPKDEDTTATPPSTSAWFMKQRIGNACGTIGLLHVLANVVPTQQQQPKDGTWLKKFLDDTQTLDPLQRAVRLESDPNIAQMHDEATSSDSNATSRGDIDDRIVTHFVALVHHNGQLLELDGRKQGPIPHGPTSPETLLQDACRVVQQFMDRETDPKEVRFAITALAPKQQPQPQYDEDEWA